MAAGRSLLLLFLFQARSHAFARFFSLAVSPHQPAGQESLETSDESLSAKSHRYFQDGIAFVRSHVFTNPSLATEAVLEEGKVAKSPQPEDAAIKNALSSNVLGSDLPQQKHVNWDDVLANDLPQEEPLEPEGPDASHANFYGTLHEIVGIDGVLMVTLEPEAGAGKMVLRGKERGNATISALSEAGIIPTRFPATDAHAAAADDLKLGCYKKGHADSHKHCSGSLREPDVNKNIHMGDGCASSVEQAIADSHRRALVSAQFREHDWTAIIEDDVIPFSASSDWSDSFREAWLSIPPNAKFVRLGWCTFGEDVGPITQHVSYDDGTFRIIDWMSLQNNWYYTGGCTSGYIVHRSIIPDLLKIFPCCSPIDSCLEQEFFYSPPFCRQDMSCLGRDIMVSLDAAGSTSYAYGRTMLKQQAGVLIQDNSRIKSYRPKFNQGE